MKVELLYLISPTAPLGRCAVVPLGNLIALVTADDSTPEKIEAINGVDGSGDFTMRLNVNGAKIW